MRQKIDQIRQEIRGEREQQGTQKPYTPTPKPIPDQYPSKAKANNTKVVQEQDIIDQINALTSMTVHDEFDTDEEYDDTYTSDRQISMVKHIPEEPIEVQECIEVRAHLEYAQQLKHTQKVYAISDGGADSCVTGQMARVVHYTGRYAHLVGYDPENTKSARIPIVTADIKAKAHNGIPVILRIHETPYNEHSPITLLSEYQIREHGLVIDSVAAKHKAS